MRTLVGHTSEILWSLDLMMSESDAKVSTLISGSADGTMEWNWSNGELLDTFDAGGSYIYSLAVIVTSQNHQQTTTTATTSTGKLQNTFIYSFTSNRES
jgi:hypothetical protein